MQYHNKTHGIDVCQTVYYYSIGCDLMQIAQLDSFDLTSLIISAAIHDYEHLGYNNMFLIESQHAWAVTYNDISVCENHHLAASF